MEDEDEILDIAMRGKEGLNLIRYHVNGSAHF